MVTVTPPTVPPFAGVYANVRLQNGRLVITRAAGHLRVTAMDTLPDSLATFGGAAFDVRPSLAPQYAVALRQLAADLPNITDTVRLQAANPLATANLRCVPDGCWLVVASPGHVTWTSRPSVGVPVLLGLAHALEAAARGDTLFTPSDSLPYLRVLP
jgi:hypothetical protein